VNRSAATEPAVINGEPKNEWPFTRPVADRTTAQVNRSAATEPAVINGEPKNEPPFTQPVATRTIVIRSGGFDWGDAGVGAAGAIGVVSIVLGAAVVTSSNRRRHIAGSFE
jgi:hypothetical protein